MSKKIKIELEVADYWYSELTKVRCWMTGYEAGSNTSPIAGSDILRQIQLAIKENNKNG